MMLGGGGAVDPNDVADEATGGTLFHHAASLGNIECMVQSPPPSPPYLCDSMLCQFEVADLSRVL